MAAAPPTRPRVLVISASPVGTVMTGPAIRSYEFANALRPHAEVTLAAVEGGDGHTDLTFRQQDPRPLRARIAEADAVISQPPFPVVAGWLRGSKARLIYDLYDPEPFEYLAHRAATGESPSRAVRAKDAIWETLTNDRMLAALADGHHFVCSTHRQRDMWIGAMVGEGLIDTGSYLRDPSLRSVIDLAPFGLPDEPPVHSGSDGIRGRFRQISADDEIALWSGGIWNWLDASTAVRAMARLRDRRPRAKLVFMSHSEDVSAIAAEREARAVAADTGVLDESVFFNDAWVPYTERVDWLLEADCALSAHLDTLETRFAFRTRLLDCFWSGLPIVCTGGDELGVRIEREGLGRAVPPGDDEAMAAALEQVLEAGRDSYAERLAKVAEEYAWSRVSEPLVRFVTEREPPRRLGSSLAVRPSRWARLAGFRAARSTLNAVGLNRWPSE
jgi:glycosyltransferase involved in cell wall biosynthesis